MSMTQMGFYFLRLWISTRLVLCDGGAGGAAGHAHQTPGHAGQAEDPQDGVLGPEGT